MSGLGKVNLIALDFRLPDSIQLATAKLNKAKAFITNDERLKSFKELKVVLIKEI